MITIQQLEYFRALARTGHLTRTAEQLYITQATLSNVIANLEKQLGVKLFNRVGRRLQLSEVGRVYLESADTALDALQTGSARVEEYRRMEQQKVSVAANNSLVWAGVFRDFQDSHRDCSLRQLNCSDAEQSRKMLLNMEVDFVIAGTTDFSMAQLEYAVFREEPIYLWVAKSHPMAERKRVSLAEVKDEGFIISSRTHPFQIYCNGLFRQANLDCRVVMECDYMMVGQFIEAGLGVALTTRSAYESKAPLLHGNSVCIPLADAPSPRAIALVWNPRRSLGKAAKEFRTFLLSYAGE